MDHISRVGKPFYRKGKATDSQAMSDLRKYKLGEWKEPSDKNITR
ncbi:MAG: hypothetical protein V6Z82_02605 [Flavobacteriales bacterium]